VASEAISGVIVHSGGPAASIKTVLWAKLAFICAQAGLTAAVRLPIGEIRTVDVAWAAC
jgi:ketopantoate reductase